MKLVRVIVSSLAEETFHATIELERDGKTYAIDARPSDALALAVRTGVRIFASTEVLDRAGVEPETQVDEKLEVFREFVNSLDVDLEEEHREGPGSAEPPREYARPGRPRRRAASSRGRQAAGSARPALHRRRCARVNHRRKPQRPEVADRPEDDLRLGAGRRAGRPRRSAARRPRPPCGRRSGA